MAAYHKRSAPEGGGGGERGFALGGLAAILLGAFALRLFRLDAVSVRGDEAFTIFFSVMPLREILEVLRSGEPHPPGFFFMFRIWETLTGSSPFVARYFSLLAGVLAVPTTYVLTRAITQFRPALTASIAAFLVAISPDLLWHAQDARMYSLMVAFALLLSYAMLRYYRTRGWRWLVVYGVAAVVGMTVHYYLSVAIIGINAAFAVALALERDAVRARGWLRCAVAWAMTQIAVGVALAPWFYFARRILGGFRPSWAQPLRFDEMLLRTVQVAGLGTAVDAEFAARAGWLLVGLMLIGAVALARQMLQMAAVASTLLIAPIGVVAVMSVRAPVYLERYLVFLTPLVLILVAVSLVELGRRSGWLGGALGIALLGVSVVAISSYFFDVRFAKAPEWREAALTLTRAGAPGDLMVENFPDPAFGVHYRGAGGTLPFKLIPPSGQFDSAGVRSDVQSALREHSRIWFLPIRADNWDRDGLVERSLRAFAVLEAEYQFRDVRLLRFRGAVESSPQAEFASGLQVQSATVQQLEDGSGVQVQLALRTGSALPFRAKTFVHLVAPGGERLAQSDAETGSGFYPSPEWVPGDAIAERHELKVGSPVPPGSLIRVGFYDPASGRRLPLASENGDATEIPVPDGDGACSCG